MEIKGVRLRRDRVDETGKGDVPVVVGVLVQICSFSCISLTFTHYKTIAQQHNYDSVSESL